MQMYRAAGLPDEPYLLRPSNPRDHLTLQLCNLSSTELNTRFKEHLQQYSIFTGQTLYGLRRGTAIHDSNSGKSTADIGLRLQHAQPGGRQTQQYLDTSRETGGPVRLHAARLH